MGLRKSVMFRYVPIPPGKFQIRLGKNASGHASQVERSRISSSVENLNIPRGSCNVNKEDFKIDFHRRSRELFYLRPDCKTCNATRAVKSTLYSMTISLFVTSKKRNHQFSNSPIHEFKVF